MKGVKPGGGTPTSEPTVSVVVPVLNEEDHIHECLLAIEAQTYHKVVEILVVDGGSSDSTRRIVGAHRRSRLIDNPGRIQAEGLNLGIAEASGEVVARVDGHTIISHDYIERCIECLKSTRAAMVGGMMVPAADGSWVQRAVSAAMRSRLGAGPARFHVGGPAGWVDTVYLGCYPTLLARRVGGYDPNLIQNEDAEFAHRLAAEGGVWFEPTIRATYFPRDSIPAVARQFLSYGKARAATLRRHPSSLSPRQLVAPLFIVGLLSPWRRWVGLAYATAISARAAMEIKRDPGAAAGLLIVLPAMHLPWGLGFLMGTFGSLTERCPGMAGREQGGASS